MVLPLWVYLLSFLACFVSFISSLLTHTGHIEWHLEAGLAVQFVEAPLQAQQRRSAVPSVMYDHCKTLGIAYEGNAAGYFSTTDLKGLPLGPYAQVLGWRPRGIAAMFGWVFSFPFSESDANA